VRIVDEPCRLRKDSLPPREGGEWVEREHKRKVKVAALPEWKQKAAALHRCGVGSCSCRRAVDESCRAESDGEPCRSGNSHLQSARGVAVGAPQATQVADRFHLLSALREAVERYVHRVRPDLRQLLIAVETDDLREGTSSSPAAIDAPPARHYDPGPARRCVQAAKHAERERRFRQVKDAQARGLNRRQVARETGLSLPTVRLWMEADVLPPERRGYRQEGKVDPYGPYLLRRLDEGCTNQTLLWQEITSQGFVGTRSLVAKWVRAHRDGLPARASASEPKLPGAQHLAWLVLRAEDDGMAKDDRALWERLRRHDELAWVQGMVARFAAMVRGRQVDAFDPWVADCRAGPVPELRNVATSLEKDGAAVRAALALPWSNGPVEGHINKLKLIKRAAFGRMKLDLLRQRVLHAA